MNTLLRLSYLPAFALAAMFAVFAAGCGGGGSNPPTTPPPPTGKQHGWGEGQLTEGVRLTPDSVVALNLEPKGEAEEEDTGADGEDRIPYRLDRETHMVVEMNPDDPMYITLIASQTGKLVFEVGPENPKVEMDLPAADYDLYVHSTSGEKRVVFIQGREEKAARSPGYNAYLLATYGFCDSCDLRYARLYKIDAKNASMQGANLTGTLITSCNFEGANLQKAIFDYTQITDVDMRGANLQSAAINGVRTEGWNLSDANLTNAGFYGGNLEGVVFDRANATYAEFNNVTFRRGSAANVDFTRAGWGKALLDTMRMPGTLFGSLGYPGETKFVNCDLSGARLTSVSLNQVSIQKSNLTGANLSGVALDAAFVKTNNLTNANLVGGKLPNQIVDAKLAGANLSGHKIANTRFENTDLTGANMSRQALTGVTFSTCKMKNVLLDRVQMNMVDFERCDLANANFTQFSDIFQLNFNDCEMTGASLSGTYCKANFRRSVMRNAKLVQAYLNGTTFTDTDFSYADLRKANFSGTGDFGGNDFTGADFSGSIWDDGQRICAEGSIGACK